jgi:hypothetical protein
VSEQTIFIIGAVIFAITIYGSVMAGGLALTRIEAHELEDLDEESGTGPLASGSPHAAGEGPQEL